jgi:hypothetical protein
MDQANLGRGMAVMSTALENAGHNCNIATQAESVIMAKERLIEQLGPIRFTIGVGGSGGALAEQQIANAYPGVYQGLVAALSFPDAGTAGIQLVDNHVFDTYLTNPAAWEPGVVWDPASINAVLGTPVTANSLIFDALFWTVTPLANPSTVCAGMTADDAYNASTNPNGTRCTMMDHMINVLGPRRRGLGAGRAGDR